MVERRSPKPHVGGSSPSWPANFFRKKDDDEHADRADRTGGAGHPHGAVPRARAARGLQRLERHAAAHAPAVERVDLVLVHRARHRRRGRRLPVGDPEDARGGGRHRRRAAQGELAEPARDSRGDRGRDRGEHRRRSSAGDVRRAVAVPHRQDPEPESVEKMTQMAATKIDKKWYVVHTYSGFENKAKKSLEEKIKQNALEEFFGDILIPMENVVEMVKGEKRASKRKFFPGYILVQMELNDRTWHLVKSTPKITGFVGNARNPVPVKEEEAAVLRKRFGVVLQDFVRYQFTARDNVGIGEVSGLEDVSRRRPGLERPR